MRDHPPMPGIDLNEHVHDWRDAQMRVHVEAFEWTRTERHVVARKVSFERHQGRLRSKVFARQMGEVAEFCARAHPNGSATPGGFAVELHRLATAIMHGEFDRGRRPAILWIPERGEITRLTALLARNIAAHGREVLVEQVLSCCWMSVAAWQKWFALTNREAPASWLHFANEPGPKKKQPIKLNHIAKQLDALATSSTRPLTNKEMAQREKVSVATVVRAKRKAGRERK